MDGERVRHRPIPTTGCARQSGDTFTAWPPHCVHTNRRHRRERRELHIVGEPERIEAERCRVHAGGIGRM